ncbi:MAG: hypothetical protein ACRDWX_13600 [Acidimicrobiia bacterium]
MTEPKPGQNHLGLSFMLDTNTVTDDSPAMQGLLELHQAGWIEVARSDVVETEFLKASSDKREELLEDARRFSEYLGPAVWGHSRWGSALWGSEEDKTLLERVFAAVYSNRGYGSVSNDLRDAMHVAWAVRYGKTALVTRDKAMLKANERVSETFNGFSIWTPEKALQVAQRRKANHDFLAQRAPRLRGLTTLFPKRLGRRGRIP